MEVILKEDIRNVGKAGEIVKVSPGFARNFLLPHGKAVEADTQNVKELEHHKWGAEVRQAKLQKQSEEIAAKISAVSLSIAREAGEGDKIFGSVTTKDIGDALRKENIFVEKRQIYIQNPLRELGVFEVQVRLEAGVTANLKVSIVKA